VSAIPAPRSGETVAGVASWTVLGAIVGGVASQGGYGPFDTLEFRSGVTVGASIGFGIIAIALVFDEVVA